MTITNGYMTMGGCRYPSNYTLMQLQAELMPQYAEGRLGLKLLPLKKTDRHQIVLNKPDIFRGIQAHRGLGKPLQQKLGTFNMNGIQCTINPSSYGESECIGEEYLTAAADITSCGKPIDLTEPVSTIQNMLLHRRFTLIEYNIWNTLIYGRHRAVSLEGVVLQEQHYNTQNLATGIPWSDLDNSTPMADLMCLLDYGRMTSARFDASAVIYINQVTANCLIRNRNLDDIGIIGRDCGGSIMSLAAINEKLKANNLPMFEIYDNSWIDDNGTAQMFIPDGIALIVGSWGGKRNEKVGHYWMTRNMLGCSVTSGAWTSIQDNCKTGGIPRKIEVADGHNGAPVIEYPSRVITLNTGCVNLCAP